MEVRVGGNPPRGYQRPPNTNRAAKPTPPTIAASPPHRIKVKDSTTPFYWQLCLNILQATHPTSQSHIFIKRACVYDCAGIVFPRRPLVGNLVNKACLLTKSAYGEAMLAGGRVVRKPVATKIRMARISSPPTMRPKGPRPSITRFTPPAPSSNTARPNFTMRARP